MPAAVTLEPVAAGAPTPARRRVLGVPVALALIVLLLAEGAVRVGRSSLGTPSAWPSPELQKKYDQVVAREGRPTDVLLVGDSMMDAGGDPHALSADGGPPTVYNASLAGETLPTIADWTTTIVVPRLHPRTVVIGLSSNELNPAVLAPALGFGPYQQSRAARAAKGLDNPVDQADAFLRRWSLLYRYRALLRHPLGDPNASGDAVFDPKLTPGGQDLFFSRQRYLSGTGAGSAQAVINGVILSLRGFTVGAANVALLRRLILSLRGRGITVVLVAMPVTADLIAYHPRGAADYQSALDTYASVARAGGAAFEVPGVWPTTEFADPVHLNAAGTAHFSAYLAPLLAAAAVR